LDDQFPRVVAGDLTKDDGLDRPIELQIVCTALRGTLYLRDYRTVGGAEGMRQVCRGAGVGTYLVAAWPHRPFAHDCGKKKEAAGRIRRSSTERAARGHIFTIAALGLDLPFGRI
jgi:hypothetical protein